MATDISTACNKRLPNLIYGYDRIESGTLVLNRREAEVVRSIFSMYVQQHYGAAKIAEELNNSHINTKHGKKFRQISIIRIISNPLYTGMLPNSVVFDPELQIITTELFQRANELLSQKKESGSSFKPQQTQYIFAGVLKCKTCGNGFRRLTRTFKNTYTNWVCVNRNMHGVGACENDIRIPENELIDVIKEYVSGILLKKGYVKNKLLHEAEKRHITPDDERDIDSIIDIAFRDMENLIKNDDISNDTVKAVIDRIEVDREGNIDIFLTLFRKLGINGLF